MALRAKQTVPATNPQTQTPWPSVVRPDLCAKILSYLPHVTLRLTPSLTRHHA
jgi:hypothetical protein